MDCTVTCPHGWACLLPSFSIRLRQSLLSRYRNFERPGGAHTDGMVHAAQLLDETGVTRLVDVIDGVSQVSARIEHLALNVDSMGRQNFVDRKQHPRHVAVYVSQAV